MWLRRRLNLEASFCLWNVLQHLSSYMNLTVGIFQMLLLKSLDSEVRSDIHNSACFVKCDCSDGLCEVLFSFGYTRKN